jgi:hypothetical protein
MVHHQGRRDLLEEQGRPQEELFESIRRKDRNERKDSADYYNVTVSMMIQRVPLEVAPAPPRDPYAPDGAPSLAASLDKGFPYDD